MQIDNDASKSSVKPGQLPFLLKRSGHYLQWRNALQDILFMLNKNNNMDAIAPADTLDMAFFQESMSSEYKIAFGLEEKKAPAMPVAAVAAPPPPAAAIAC